MEVKDIFHGIASKMLVDFEQIHAQIEHDGTRGRQREKCLETFLANYLPRKYSLGTGHVMDPNGVVSKQCDIVIYDSLNCPVLLVEDDYQLFPVEAVFGVVEVKSVLDAGKIAKGVQNIQSVKQLKRDEPVAGAVFAYRSRYKVEPRIETAANALNRINKPIPSRERVDLVCVLTDGIVIDFKEAPDWGEKGNKMAAFSEVQSSTLLLFLTFLLTVLEQRHSSMPFLLEYSTKADSFELGVVSIMTSVGWSE